MESKRDGHHCGSSMVCSMSFDLRISSSHCGRWEKDRNLCSKQARGALPKRFLPLREFLRVTELSRSICVCDRETAGPQAHQLRKGKGVCREMGSWAQRQNSGNDLRNTVVFI